MGAAPAGSLGPASADSLEVRWIIRGQLDEDIRDWFAHFPAGTEARADTYLVWPRLGGLSVKLRDGSALDVKSYLGSPGTLNLPHSGRGRLESWRKWSFPYDPPAQVHAPDRGWVVVRKRRLSTWFPLAAGQDPAPAPRPSALPGCTAELTEADAFGDAWWSVGLEATGPAGLLHGALQHAADLVFARPLPAGTGFSLENSQSYAQWLRQLSTR